MPRRVLPNKPFNTSPRGRIYKTLIKAPFGLDILNGSRRPHRPRSRSPRCRGHMGRVLGESWVLGSPLTPSSVSGRMRALQGDNDGIRWYNDAMVGKGRGVNGRVMRLTPDCTYIRMFHKGAKELHGNNDWKRGFDRPGAPSGHQNPMSTWLLLSLSFSGQN